MKHIIGENYLCFYSLMEMILDDLGYVEWNQFSLANQFGVVLPNNYVISGVKNVKISNDERMYGAHIDCRKINEFMETFKIPLKVSDCRQSPRLFAEDFSVLKRLKVSIFKTFQSLFGIIKVSKKAVLFYDDTRNRKSKKANADGMY